ncbi:MAG TPA: ECF transporter S component, partial [Clostridia bacterium]|nr:ECF transporter S component [Clostridia bacterium]
MEKAKKSFLTKFTAANVAKIAILTALSFVLYAFGKFNVPFMFPGFLEFQFSELPALLAGFSIGPISGCLVIIFKCLLKFPLSSTAFVGELTDILLGVLFVLPASLLYKYNKCKKTALIGILIGIAASTAGA